MDRLQANIGELAQQFAGLFRTHIRAGLSHRSLSLAVVERSHRTATDFLAKALSDGLAIDQMTLDLLSLAVNGTYHASIGTTPLHAMTGAPQPDIRNYFPSAFQLNTLNDNNKTKYLSAITDRLTRLRERVFGHLKQTTETRNRNMSYTDVHAPRPPYTYVYALSRTAPRSGTKLQERRALGRVCRIVSPTHYRVKLEGARAAISLHRQDIYPCLHQHPKNPIKITREDYRRPIIKVSADQWWARMETIQRERTQRPEGPEDTSDFDKLVAAHEEDLENNWSEEDSDAEEDTDVDSGRLDPQHQGTRHSTPENQPATASSDPGCITPSQTSKNSSINPRPQRVIRRPERLIEITQALTLGSEGQINGGGANTPWANDLDNGAHQ